MMAPLQAALPDGSKRLETVKRAFDAFAQRDVDAMLAFLHPQIRLWVVTAAVTREGRPYTGHAGIREYARDVNRMWQELELLPTRFHEIGEAIVVVGEVRARGAGGAVRAPTVWTWKFSGDLVIDCRVDSDVRAARTALGESKTVEELLRRFVAAFNRRDLDEMIALADPAVVSYPSAILRGSRRFVGHDGLREWIRNVLTPDYGHVVVVSEIRKLERQRWAVLGEIAVDETPMSPFVSLVAVTNGLIAEWHEYLSEEGLLRHLGHLP
jgi:ketosteroid isomerase-like protein